MLPDLKDKLIAAHRSLPDGIGHPPAGEDELAHFEAKFGPIPEEFRWYLSACGGGVVGSEWVNNISQLSRSHEKFGLEAAKPNGWRMQDVFIIGWDGAGNPFGIERATGRLLVEDHNFGGIHEMAPSFEAFLVRGLEPDKRHQPVDNSLREDTRLHLPLDCEAEGKKHQWFNINGELSGCYNCRTRAAGRMWAKK